MTIKIKNALFSAFFGALGPFLNKQATLEEDSTVYKYFSTQSIPWAIYPFDIVCFVLMLVVNTISVKYKMLSYKYDGAFIGTSLIFVLSYLFSAIFDYIYEGGVPTIKQSIGAFMMIFGIMLISSQEDGVKLKKKTNSFNQLIQEGEEDDGSESPKVGDPKVEGLIDKSKPPTDTLLTTPTTSKEPSNDVMEPESPSKEELISRGRSQPASRHIPGAIGALDFIHLRKGYL